MDERVSYGLVSKGNGDVILSKERHTSLSCGGGQAGQGYPAVMICEVQMDDEVTIINSSGGGIATTLDSHYYKGQGEREGIEREYLLILNDQGGGSNERDT